MGRLIAGVASGVIFWFVVVFVVGFVVRVADPALAVALNAHATLDALGERLVISFLASLVGGYLAALIAKGNGRAALGSGIVLLLIFAPYHILSIWQQFPIWYHLTFFVSLPVLGWLGGRFAR